MFTTLQAAFGTWPSDSSHRRTGALDIGGTSGLNERISFGDDGDDIPAASSVFVLRPDIYPSGKVFIPPYFVPPGAQPVEQRDEVLAQSLQDALRHEAQPVDASASSVAVEGPSDLAGGPLYHMQEASNVVLHQIQPEPDDCYDRTISPPPDEPDIGRQREVNWSDSARRAFHAMVHAPSYVNRYRLSSEKYHRLRRYLRDPNIEPLCQDGSKDHQTKYQASHWILKGDKLHRKVESKAFGRSVRRHLDLDETWDVLTAEHLRSGHLGRDRLRKLLEKKFIGYTLQEIMFVLRECKRCSGGEKAAVASEPRVDEPGLQLPGPDSTEVPVQDIISQPTKRKQTSNMMWF